MDSAMTAPPNPVVMAQQIQALTSNVQELIKQNEELKQKARLEGRVYRSLDATIMTMMTRPRVQAIIEGKLQNTPRS